MALFEGRALFAKFSEIKKSIVYVGNIPNNCSKKEIIQLFQRFGEILNIHLQDNKKPLCNVKIAHVRFRKNGNAISCAEELDNTEFGTTVLIVKTLTMSYSDYLLLYEATIAVSDFGKDDLVEIKNAYESFGKIFTILKRSNTFVFIMFYDKPSVVAALSKGIPKYKTHSICRNVDVRTIDIVNQKTKATENIIKMLVNPRCIGDFNQHQRTKSLKTSYRRQKEKHTR